MRYAKETYHVSKETYHVSKETCEICDMLYMYMHTCDIYVHAYVFVSVRGVREHLHIR